MVVVFHALAQAVRACCLCLLQCLAPARCLWLGHDRGTVLAEQVALFVFNEGIADMRVGVQRRENIGGALRIMKRQRGAHVFASNRRDLVQRTQG